MAQSRYGSMDEISEMDVGLQAKLLRVIQEREVERIGGRRTIALDVRVLATTNRDLRQYVTDGKFREDLFYRLHVFPLLIAPLRERRGDILPLAELAIGRYFRGDRSIPTLSDCARQKLMEHDWPGNVRQLENLIQRSLILLNGNVITAVDLMFEGVSEDLPQPVGTCNGLQNNLWERESQLILDALHKERGNRKATAIHLDISTRTLRYKLAQMRQAGVSLPHEFASQTTRSR